MRVFSFDLHEASTVYADKAYNDYEIEDLLLEAENIKLSAIRKQNSKRPVAGYVQLEKFEKRRSPFTINMLGFTAFNLI